MSIKRGVGVNRRGQEGVTLTTLLLIILGGVVVLVVILGATGTLGKIFGQTKFLPGDLESVVQSCKLAIDAGLTASYCGDFKEVTINGVKQVVNCESNDVTPYLGGKSLTCDTASVLIQECNSLIAAAPDSTQPGKKVCKDILSVNGRTCDVMQGNNWIGKCVEAKPAG